MRDWLERKRERVVRKREGVEKTERWRERSCERRCVSRESFDSGSDQNRI